MTKKIEKGIFKEKNGTYTVRLASSLKGKYFQKIKRGLFKIGDARFQKKIFEEELICRKQKIKKEVLTWEVAVEEYLDQAKYTLSPSTFIETKISLNGYFADWSNVLLSEVTKTKIHNRIQEKNSQNSEKTKRKILGYVRNVFNLQCDSGAIQKNPTIGIKFSNNKMKSKKLTAMTISEINFFLKKAKEYEHPWFPVWYVVYQTGMRSSEALGLQLKHIDFENNHIHIIQSYERTLGKSGPTKNKYPRIIPLNQELKQFLNEYKIQRLNEEYLLPHFPAWLRGEAAKVLRSFQREIKIKETNFHSLRSSFITHLLLRGVPMIKVQNIVGHGDLKTTSRYVRLSASDLKGTTESIGVDLSDTTIPKILELKNT